MKIFESPLDVNKQQPEIHAEAKQKQEYKFIGKCRVKEGCKLFAYNSEEDSMTEVQLNKKASFNLATMQAHDSAEAQYNPNYTYFQAINEKNARRKLARYRNGEYEIAERFNHDDSIYLKIKPY